MDVYIGLDVSLATTAICVASAQGKIVIPPYSSKSAGKVACA